ncbi:MAG: hypothetical protein KBT58_10685 [Bizionia sp.]|nr:hypothetical protein [Bizionia sp.]
MKTVLKYLLFTFGVLICGSCNVDDDDDAKTHYQFNSENNDLIINYNYQIGQTITYQNQDGEQIHFKVILNETKKQGDYVAGTFSGGSGGLSHYYDSKIIRFEIIENQNYERNGIVNYIFSKNFDKLNNGINFPMWNISNFAFIDEIQNPANIIMSDFNNQTKAQMTINNHTYKKVVEIESGSNDEYLNSSYGTISKNVNKVFYDYDFGIIQFDDINGKEWKLIYPE